MCTDAAKVQLQIGKDQTTHARTLILAPNRIDIVRWKSVWYHQFRAYSFAPRIFQEKPNVSGFGCKRRILHGRWTLLYKYWHYNDANNDFNGIESSFRLEVWCSRIRYTSSIEIGFHLSSQRCSMLVASLQILKSHCGFESGLWVGLVWNK